MKVALTVNGRIRDVDVEPRKTLLDVLREDLALVGSHAGCEHGVCGACTILLDGEAVRSCLMFAAQADGYSIKTIEGLAPAPGELSVVQDAFCETHGMQCGFCTPGMILAAQALLDREPEPTREDTSTQFRVTSVAARVTGRSLKPLSWLLNVCAMLMRRKRRCASNGCGHNSKSFNLEVRLV